MPTEREMTALRRSITPQHTIAMAEARLFHFLRKPAETDQHSARVLSDSFPDVLWAIYIMLQRFGGLTRLPEAQFEEGVILGDVSRDCFVAGDSRVVPSRVDSRLIVKEMSDPAFLRIKNVQLEMRVEGLVSGHKFRPTEGVVSTKGAILKIPTQGSDQFQNQIGERVRELAKASKELIMQAKRETNQQTYSPKPK